MHVRVAEHRLEEVAYEITAAQCFRDCQPSGGDRSDGEQHKRYSHGLGRFMKVMLLLVGAPEFSMECQKNYPETVECGERSDQRSHGPHNPADSPAVIGQPEDLIFAEKACETGDTGNAQ